MIRSSVSSTAFSSGSCSYLNSFASSLMSSVVSRRSLPPVPRLVSLPISVKENWSSSDRSDWSVDSAVSIPSSTSLGLASTVSSIPTTRAYSISRRASSMFSSARSSTPFLYVFLNSSSRFRRDSSGFRMLKLAERSPRALPSVASFRISFRSSRFSSKTF